MHQSPAQAAMREQSGRHKLIQCDVGGGIEDLCICPLIVSVEDKDVLSVHQLSPGLAKVGVDQRVDASENLRRAHCVGPSKSKCPNVYSVRDRKRKKAPNRPINPIDCRLGSWTRSKEYRAIPVGSRRISQEFQRRKSPIYTPAALKA